MSHLAWSKVSAVLPQDHARRKWVIVGFFSMPVLGAMVAIAGSVDHAGGNEPTVNSEVVLETIPLDLTNHVTLTPAPLVKEERIKRGDHILTTLERAGVEAEGLQAFLSGDSVGKLLFSQLRAGRSITVQMDESNQLNWMRYKLNHADSYVESVFIERSPEGEYSAELQKLEFDKDLAFRSGRIESSLFGAADSADLPESVAIKMAEIYSSQIDFHRELREGDQFRVVYEQLSLDGEPVGSGRVLAVDFVNDGRSHKAFYFESPQGKTGYYDEKGMSLRSTFLRSPLKFSRISSGFSKRRFHPIQGRWKAHNGVDYAAPTGTPIHATANGRVELVGRKGGYGNVVYLKHNNGYSTRYAHMSRFARGLRNGDRVEQGDIIGYVGATGWATGPHLHYEFRVNESPRDPLTIKLARLAEPLTREEMTQFKRAQYALERRLNLANTVQLAKNDTE
ncbi:MAG: peptidoglycan DD-metalloendopeptidase family protein [Limnobacter sp.]|nr:peptidoglycan DD-metalloendopeptidase family protein [Limnobacter sp.]